ncbi:hypothetical protein KEM09_05115 [Carboxylicivirga mesophila]|uniref:Uncharacterized protein n=1 Tax=Carboxylicivirga mesophila TaxID=1166478 RepID=A0ABS5K8D4_9BACT|nr:hypothetical protein [Carboxylicivirga mesophila]MBS2210766.1 hypothetical protein [Carboxylicivirga mesophila]
MLSNHSKQLVIILFITIVLLPITGNEVLSQQFNSDNYLTMPHGTGTFVLSTGERNSAMYATFSLLPKFELNFSSALFWEDKKANSPQHFSTNIFGKYMFWVNDANTGGAAMFLGVGRAPGYYNQSGYSAFHKNYWTAIPITFPLFNNAISWDIMPGALVDFDYGSNKKKAWGFTWSTRVAIYKIIPRTGIVAEVYGIEGEISSKTEYKVGLRWEPNDYIIPAISYGSCFDGSSASGFEFGIIIFTPPFLKKEFIKNNDIQY